MGKAYKYSRLTLIGFALLLLGLFFLPLAPLRGEYRQNVEAAQAIEGFELREGSNLSVLDYQSLSIFGLTKVILNSENEVYGFAVVFVVFGVLCAFVFIFSLFPLYIPVFIFDALAMLLYHEISSLINFRLLIAFTRRYGFSYYLYYPTFIAILVIDIELLIANIKIKKERKRNERVKS